MHLNRRKNVRHSFQILFLKMKLHIFQSIYQNKCNLVKFNENINIKK